MALKPLAPVWFHQASSRCIDCQAVVEVMRVTFPNHTEVTLRICPRCDRLTPNPALL